MSITGNLRTLELSELLQWLAQGKKTGTLVVEQQELEKRIYFQDGRIISSSSNDPEEHLGTFLIERGYIDEATLEHAMKLQEATQILLGKVLVTLDSISEDDLEKILRLKTEESVYELFTWDEGDFRFVKDEMPDAAMVPVSLEVTNIVMEGMRRIDESNHGGASAPELPASRQARDLEADGVPSLVVELQPVDPVDENLEDLEPHLLVAEEGNETGDEAGSEEDSGELGGSPEIRGYYQTLPQGKPQKIAIFGGAAALVIVLGLLIVWIFRQQPEPAAADIADAVATEASPPPYTVAPVTPELDTLLPPDAGVELGTADEIEAVVEPEPDPGPTPEEIEQRVQRLAAAQSAEIEESLKTQYEEELVSLRRQLALARQAALERERALQAQVDRAQTEAAPANTETTPPTRETTGGASPAASPQTAAGQTVPNPSPGSTTSSPSNPPVQMERPPVARETTEAVPAPDPEPVQPEVKVGDLVTPGPGVIAPKLVRGPLPRYPPIAQRMKREADVRVSLLVDENGRVIEAHSIGSKAGMGFEQAAVDAARKTTWTPAEKNGIKVKIRLEVTIEFRL
ncbi:MAG: TonB family protein [Acidobacteria bacterium]|nr:MAG: TonB family protein [Acidobacteriota bacterium]